MISSTQPKLYCKEDISLIENYEKAVADTTQTWEVHHRLETHKYKDRARTEWTKRDEAVPARELRALGLYYNRPASELVFLTNHDHQKLHGAMVSADTRAKIAERPCSGERNGFYGKRHSEETRRKMSVAHKGRPPANKGKKHTEVARRKMSEARKGKHWKLVDGKRTYY